MLPMNNVKPRDRNERISNKNRETIEKAFISDRIGAYNKKSEPLKINDPESFSSLYINESERFNKDFASNEYQRRLEENEKKRKRNEYIRSMMFEKEQNRWEKMEYEYMKEVNKAMLNKEKNILGKKNNPGLAFNPITLDYDKSIQGELLRNKDEHSKYRAQLRLNNLEIKTNNKYNLLTGDERNYIRDPIKPKFFGQA